LISILTHTDSHTHTHAQCCGRPAGGSSESCTDEALQENCKQKTFFVAPDNERIPEQLLTKDPLDAQANNTHTHTHTHTHHSPEFTTSHRNTHTHTETLQIPRGMREAVKAHLSPSLTHTHTHTHTGK